MDHDEDSEGVLYCHICGEFGDVALEPCPLCGELTCPDCLSEMEYPENDHDPC